MVKSAGRKVVLIIEGAAKEAPLLQIELREAFHKLLQQAGIQNFPKIVAGGGRAQAYDCFKSRLKYGEYAILLVDSEKAVEEKYKDRPWDYLKTVESWDWMQNLDDTQCHLMVQCMEAWFFADKTALEDYFGNGFNRNKLPETSIEGLSIERIVKSLNDAVTDCKTKKEYLKGRDSFKILKLLNPKAIEDRSDWTRRFFRTIHEIMDSELSSGDPKNAHQ